MSSRATEQGGIPIEIVQETNACGAAQLICGMHRRACIIVAIMAHRADAGAVWRACGNCK